MGVNDKQDRKIRRERKRLFRRRERSVTHADLQATLNCHDLKNVKCSGKHKTNEKIDIYKCVSQESHRRRTTRQKYGQDDFIEEYLPNNEAEN